MTIARIKTAGWAANEKLTSAQMNAVDVNVTNALDKRSGQTDTCASTVTFTGPIVFSNTIVANNNATFNGPVTVTSGLSVSGGATFSGALTVSHSSTWSGALTLNSGASLTVHDVATFAGGMAVTNGMSANAILADALSLTGTAVVAYSGSRSFTRCCPEFVIDGNWNVSPLGASVVDANPNPVAGPAVALIPVTDIPDGATWTFAIVTYTPTTGHSAAPVSVPSIELYAVEITTGIENLLASATGPHTGGTASAYQVITNVIVGLPGATIIDRSTYRYVIKFYSESGTRAVLGLTLWGARVSFTATKMNQF